MKKYNIIVEVRENGIYFYKITNNKIPPKWEDKKQEIWFEYNKNNPQIIKWQEQLEQSFENEVKKNGKNTNSN